MSDFRIDERREEEGANVWVVTVPDDSSYFEGHFPGEPVLPAVGQMALIEVLLRELLDERVSIRAFDSMRFRAPLGPGDQLEVRLAPAMAPAGKEVETSTFECELRRAGQSITRGRLRVASADGPTERA
jgi:3-hydroxymyristoyl/3-hydroxydecanoyl-(acyl carrier protein) dehydratase